MAQSCFKFGRYDKKLIQHHISYNPEKKALCCISCHKKIHMRLRKEGKCKVPVNELRKISTKLNHNTDHGKSVKREYRKKNVTIFRFKRTIAPNIMIVEQLYHNSKNGNIHISSHFLARRIRLYELID